jgi:hypothetical protein
MPRRTMLSIFVIASIAVPAQAADLPARSRLGAVFAEPAEAAPRGNRTDGGPIVVYAPEVGFAPLVTGYYGKPNSYHHAPYYGSSIFDWAPRLPYACGFYGYC